MEEEILGKAYDARLMRRLLRYLRPYTMYVAIALAAIISASVLQLAQPYIMKLAIDRYIATGDLQGLNRIALIFFGVLVGSFTLEYLQTWVLQMTGQRIMFDLRTEIYEHLQRLDMRFFDRNPVGRLMTRVTTDVDVLNDLFTAGVVSIFGDVFTLLGIMIVLVIMDWRLALVAFAVLPLIVVVTQWFRRHVRDSYRTVRTWIARINAFLQEHITGMATVQLFRRERRSSARFDEINSAHRDANVDSILYYAVFYPAIEVIGALASALIIWFGGGWTMEGTLTLGSLVAFLQYSQRFFRPISDMSEKFNVLQAAMASSERIFTLLDTPVTIVSGLAARDSGLRPGLAARDSGLGNVKVAGPVGDRGFRGSLVAPGVSGQLLAPSAVPGLPSGERRAAGPGSIAFDHVWFAYSGKTTSCETCRSRSVLASALASSARRARGSPRSSTSCCGSTMSARAAFWWMASISGRWSCRTCDRSSASSCRMCISSRARLRATFGSAAPPSPTMRSGGPPQRCMRARSSNDCRSDTRALSPSGARRCRSGRSSCCRSPVRWPSTHVS